MAQASYAPTSNVPRDIPTALVKLGIDAVVRGDEATAACPAHEDSHPSWSCNLSTGMHNCFSCGFHGSFTGLVRHQLGVTWDQAEAWCKEQRVQDLISYEPGPPPAKKRARKTVSEADLALFTSPPKHALRSRHLSASAAEQYGILWDDAKLQWIIPIRDAYTGRLWGWQRKNAHSFRNIPRGVAKSRTLFRARCNGDAPATAVLVESPLDACRLLSAGIEGGVASYGVQTTPIQWGILLDFFDEVVVAFDNDRAGLEAAHTLKNSFRAMRLSFFNYSQTKAKDPGEMSVAEIRWAMGNLVGSSKWH